MTENNYTTQFNSMLRALRHLFHVKGPSFQAKVAGRLPREMGQRMTSLTGTELPHPSRECNFPLCNQQPSGTWKHWKGGEAQLPFNIEALSPLAHRKVQLLLWMCKERDEGKERTEPLVCVYKSGWGGVNLPALPFCSRRFIWPASVPVSWCWQNCLQQQIDSLSWLSEPKERGWVESCQPRRGNSQAHSLEPLAYHRIQWGPYEHQIEVIYHLQTPNASG